MSGIKSLLATAVMMLLLKVPAQGQYGSPAFYTAYSSGWYPVNWWRERQPESSMKGRDGRRRVRVSGAALDSGVSWPALVRRAD